MTYVDAALAELERGRALRSSAEARTGAAWNDVVYRQLERRQLDPLASEESRYLVAVRELDRALDRCLARVDNR